MRALIFPLGLVVLLAACSSAGPSPVPTERPLTLEGTSWRATTVGGRVPPADHPVTLGFAGGKVEGSGGCNSYGGAARLDGGRLVADEIQMTLMACADPEPNEIEGTFIRILGERPTVTTDGSRLLLRGTSGEIVLEPGPPVR
jgi:putative lipoprotein